MGAVKPVVPRGEALRKALRWLAEQDRTDIKAVEQAARQFDLSPLEEDFLGAQYVRLVRVLREAHGQGFLRHA